MIRRGLLSSLAPLIAAFGLGLWGFIQTEPGTLFPVHWTLDGQPNRWADRWQTFLAIPFLALGITVLRALLPRIDPRAKNLYQSQRTYLALWVAAVSVCALIQAGLTLTALGVWAQGPDSQIHRVVPFGIGLFLAVIGNILGKARANWFLGVRTPWTLSSDIAWDRTHRLVGWLFVIVGVLGCLFSFLLPTGHAVGVLLVGLLATSMTGVVYSYLVWRRAPDRHEISDEASG